MHGEQEGDDYYCNRVSYYRHEKNRAHPLTAAVLQPYIHLLIQNIRAQSGGRRRGEKPNNNKKKKTIILYVLFVLSQKRRNISKPAKVP